MYYKIIITVSLVNIHPLTYLDLFFLVMNTKQVSAS